MKPDDKKIWKIIDQNEEKWRLKRKRSEDLQTVDSVIDLHTTKNLKKLQVSGFIGSLTGTIASGKESGVFLAELGPKGEEICNRLSVKSPIIIKIYRTSTLNFKRISDYISGDSRFRKHSRKTRHIMNLWVEKEYKNLQRCSLANVSVPKPILVRQNILLMELLGKDGIPFPLLKNSPEAFTDSLLDKIINQITILFQDAGIVHGDLSPFNILIDNQIPYLIDMSQSLLVSHPRAFEFLRRDLNNIISSFSIKQVPTPDIEELFGSITKEAPDKNLIM